MVLLTKWAMVRWTVAQKRGRQHQESDGWKLQEDLLVSASEIFERTDEIKLNQDHVLDWEANSARSCKSHLCTSTNPIPSIHDGYTLIHSAFICWPETCSAKKKRNTIALRLPRQQWHTSYWIACQPMIGSESVTLTTKKTDSNSARPENNSFEGFDELWRVYSPSIFNQFAWNLARDFMRPLTTKAYLRILLLLLLF